MRMGPISPNRNIAPHHPIWLSAALMPMEIKISVYPLLPPSTLLHTPYPDRIYLRENNVRNGSVYGTWQIILCENKPLR